MEVEMQTFPEVQTQEFEVSSDQAGERLDKILSLIYQDMSRSFFSKIDKKSTDISQ